MAGDAPVEGLEPWLPEPPSEPSAEAQDTASSAAAGAGFHRRAIGALVGSTSTYCVARLHTERGL